MTEVVGNVRKVVDIMHDIATASREQSEGIDHVSSAMISIEAGTQQNARMVEGAAELADKLYEQARQMTLAFSVFKMDGEVVAQPTVRTISESMETLHPVTKAASQLKLPYQRRRAVG
jgi:uncharacterized phage infection (PIP) family protein YhgE